MYSISTRLRVNNHRSFFFYLNNFVLRIMTSFGNIRRYFASSAGNPWFALYVIHLVVRGLFPMFFGINVLSRMSSSLLCIYLLI